MGVGEFRGRAAPGSEAALDHLLGLQQVPTDRTSTWHAVASVLVITRKGDVLLARNRSGGWGTVGGHIEPTDADLRSAAARELAEEVGLAIAPEDLHPLVLVADEAEFRPGHAHWDFCFALPVPARVAVAPADDVSEVCWTPVAEPPAMNEHMDAAVAALRRWWTGRRTPDRQGADLP